MFSSIVTSTKSKTLIYLRLIRFFSPAGCFLLFYPCVFSLILCISSLREILWIPYFAFGAFIMRSFGCIINDLIDQDIDRKIARTKNRAIASGEVSNMEAIVLALFFGSIGAVMLLFANVKLFFVIGIPISFFILIYPLQKRFFIPQLFLSIVFNTGIIFVSYIVLGYLDERMLLLYIGCIFWCIYYDLIYAHQDREDDIYIGVKSLSLSKFGSNKIFIAFLYSMFFACLILCAYLYNFRFFSLSLLVLIFVYNIRMLLSLNLDDNIQCYKHFCSQAFDIGGLICLCLFLGKIL